MMKFVINTIKKHKKIIFLYTIVFILVSLSMVNAAKTTTTTQTTTTSSTTTTTLKQLTQFEKIQIYIFKTYNIWVTGYQIINRYQVDDQKFFICEIYTDTGKTYTWIVSQTKALEIWRTIK